MCKCLVSQLLYTLHIWQNAGVGIEANIGFCVHNVATHGVVFSVADVLFQRSPRLLLRLWFSEAHLILRLHM